MGLGAPAASLLPFVGGPLTDVISRRIFSFQRSQEEIFLLACIREKTGILTTLLVQIIFDFFQNALFPLMDGLLRHPQPLSAFPFGEVLEVKFIDQLVVFRRKQLQNIMQGLEYHLLNGLIFGRIVIIYKLVEPLVSIIFSANQRTHLRLMLKKAFRAIFDIPFRSPVSLKYLLGYLDEFVLAGHGIVNIENINFFGHFLISF